MSEIKIQWGSVVLNHPLANEEELGKLLPLLERVGFGEKACFETYANYRGKRCRYRFKVSRPHPRERGWWDADITVKLYRDEVQLQHRENWGGALQMLLPLGEWKKCQIEEPPCWEVNGVEYYDPYEYGRAHELNALQGLSSDEKVEEKTYQAMQFSHVFGVSLEDWPKFSAGVRSVYAHAA